MLQAGRKNKFTILSLFPGYFEGPFNESILKRAKERELIEICLVDIRDYSEDKHKKVDDRPFGGGPGMVMKPEPVAKAIRAHRTEKTKVVYLGPEGETFSAKKAREFSKEEDILLLSGHYEGIDQRVIDSDVDEVISIGDYVLTSGCAAAIVFVDAVCRFIPGVLGDPRSAEQDSFEEEGLLDCPHYTQPRVFEGKCVPEVLLSGHHKNIDAWRREQRNVKEKLS